MRTGLWCSGRDNIIDNEAGSASNFYIMVIDKTSSYKTFHRTNIFYNFVDIGHSVFADWDVRVPGGVKGGGGLAVTYCTNENATNIPTTEFSSIPQSEMCVYELVD
jgi:hypothetical protein